MHHEPTTHEQRSAPPIRPHLPGEPLPLWSGVRGITGSPRRGYAPQIQSSCAVVLQIVLLVAGEQPIHAAELPAVRNHILRSLSDLERSLAPALPFPRSGFIGTLAAEIRMHEKGHIQGHRYALVDAADAAAACAATPLAKLQTATSTTCQAALSLTWHDCRRHLAMERARRRRELQDAASRTSVGRGADGAGGGDMEQGGRVGEGAAGASAVPGVVGARAGAAGASGAIAAADLEGGGAAVAAEAPGGSAGGAARVDVAQVRADAAAAAAAGDPAVRMEMLAQAPNRKWIAAKWALGGEVVHADDVATRDRNSLASAHRNVQSMLSTYFPGVLGL